MGELKKFFLYLSLLLIYTQGLMERMFSVNPLINLVVELPVIIFILIPDKRKMRSSPAIPLLFVYLFISLLSAVFNSNGIVLWLKYIRYFVYFILIYHNLWNARFSYREWGKLFRFIGVLIILQGISSVWNIFVLKSRIEGYVGLMSSLGGTTAAIFPLVIISLSLLYYLHARRKGIVVYGILILFVLTGIFLGYSSSKRIIFFLIPLFVVIVSLLYVLSTKNRINYTKILTVVAAGIIMFPAAIYGIKTSHGINTGLTGDEKRYDVVRNAAEYSLTYTKGTTEYGETTGRTGTTRQVIEKSLNNLHYFLFGYGYGQIKSEATLSNLGIEYGIVGFTRDIISGGWIVMILAFLIVTVIIFTNNSAPLKFSKRIRITLFLIFCFSHFFYSSDFVAHLDINFIMAVVCAFINSPANRGVLLRFVKETIGVHKGYRVVTLR